jgi:hypothetical protein
MAQVTNWLKRLGRPSHRRPVSVIALEDLKGGLELWITDEDNRVIRCALERHEITALSESIAKYLNKAKEDA